MKNIIMTLLLLSTILYSASFDCSKATTTIEKTICKNNELGNLDTLLNDNYLLLKSSLKKDDFKAVKIRQRQWLKSLKSVCKNKSNIANCLIDEYKKRITELNLKSVSNRLDKNEIDNGKYVCKVTQVRDLNESEATYAGMKNGPVNNPYVYNIEMQNEVMKFITDDVEIVLKRKKENDRNIVFSQKDKIFAIDKSTKNFVFSINGANFSAKYFGTCLQKGSESALKFENQYNHILNRSIPPEYKSRVQSAIDNIYTNPKELLKYEKLFQTALLKAYSLYIYNEKLLDDLPVSEQDTAFNKLINELKQEEQDKVKKDNKKGDFLESLRKYEFDNKLDNSVLVDIQEIDKSYKKQKIATLINYLHFTGYDDALCIPNYAFSEEWGDFFVGTYGGYSSIFILNSICKLPEEKYILSKNNDNYFLEYYSILEKILGNPGAHICGGSMEYAIMSSKQISLFEFSLPSKSLIDSSSLDYQQDELTEKYIRYWSSQGVWNLKVFNEYKSIYKKAEEYLYQYYRKMNIEQAKAKKLAQFVMQSTKYKAAGIINETTIKELINDNLYKNFYTTNTSLEKIKKLNINFSKEIATKALKYVLLSSENKTIIDFLLENGAQLNDGIESALFFALGNSEIVEYLIKKGANVNYENSFKKTPIMSAIQLNNIETIRILIKNGANLQQKTISIQGYKDDTYSEECYNISRNNLTPLLYALKDGNLEIIKLLIMYSMATSNDKPRALEFLKINELLRGDEKKLVNDLINKNFQ